MTIVQITATSGSTARGSLVSQVFGLGDDQKIYVWGNESHEWRLWTS